MTTRSISLRTDEETLKKIDAYAGAEDRSRNWWINRAIAAAIAEEEAFTEAVREGIRQADAGNTVPHDQVIEEMRLKYLGS